MGPRTLRKGVKDCELKRYKNFELKDLKDFNLKAKARMWP